MVSRKLLWEAILVIVATAMLSWPLVQNRYPVVFPDSVLFMGAGRKVLSVVGIKPPQPEKAVPRSAPDAPVMAAKPPPDAERAVVYRSPFYGAVSMLVAHITGGWPGIAIAQALWAAIALSLALPKFGIAGWTARLFAVALIASVTSLGFYTNVLLPDVFAGLIPLAAFMLIVHDGVLSAYERLFWRVTLLGAALFHVALLLLTIALLVIFSIPIWRLGTAARRQALTIAMLCGIAGFGHVMGPKLKAKLDDVPVVSPPFVLARMIGDGTAGLVLGADCPTRAYVTCLYLGALPMTENQFLWTETKVTPWANLPASQRIAVVAEQAPIAASVLTRFARKQLSATLTNTTRQFVTVDLRDFDPDPILPTLMKVSGFKPELALFEQTPIGAGTSNNATLARFWAFFYFMSLAVIGAALAYGTFNRNRISPGLQAFLWVVLAALVSNAAINGGLAGVFGRYQGRISWIAVLAAGLAVEAMLKRKPARTD